MGARHMYCQARIILLQLAIMILPASAAGDEQWRVYNVARFGAIAEVPNTWSIIPPPTNNGGRSFLSPDGTAEIVISGMLSSDVMADLKDSTKPYPDNKETVVTYRRVGTDWAVASGYRSDGKIFYRKSIAACGDRIINSVYIDYPRARKQEFDSIVQHVARSLRNANVSDECP